MSPFHIEIVINSQKLFVFKFINQSWIENTDRWTKQIPFNPIFSTQVSTAANGVGQELDSFKTPLGKHIIRAKIGENSPLESVFVGRRLTGEIWNKKLSEKFPNRDWILTRILWLSGIEQGINRFGSVDTMKRYIYIHGSPPTVLMGNIGSKGCVRMKGKDIVYLFNLVPVGTTVNLKL